MAKKGKEKLKKTSVLIYIHEEATDSPIPAYIVTLMKQDFFGFSTDTKAVSIRIPHSKGEEILKVLK